MEISRTTLVIFVKDVFLINIKRNTGVGGGVIYILYFFVLLELYLIFVKQFVLIFMYI